MNWHVEKKDCKKDLITTLGTVSFMKTLYVSKEKNENEKFEMCYLLDNSNNSLSYRWTSSKSSVLKVDGSGNKANLTSFGTEGNITIACELIDDVHKYNPGASVIKKSVKIQIYYVD